jgi:cytochrome P450
MSDGAEHEALFATVDPSMVRCPYPTYAHLRGDHPIQWLESIGAFAVTRYVDVMNVLRRTEEFSSARQSGPGAATNLARRVAADPSYDEQLRAMATRRLAIAQNSPVLVNADPPKHSRQRRLMNRTFAPSRVGQLEPGIQALTDELIDRFVGRGSADLVGELAIPLPMTVIARALGIEGVEGIGPTTLKRWSDSFVKANGNPPLTTEEITELFSSMMACYDFFTAQLEDRHREPRDDLLNDVAHAKIGDEELTFNEQLQISTLFMIAGNETTTSLIGSAMLMLLRDAATLQRLRDDASLIPAYLEEALRLEPPVQGLFRIANADTEVGGTAIPAGSFLWLLYGSGNRDADVFSDADDVAFDRVDGRPHLSFGGGPHFCLGANLARAEARIALESLLRRLPELELAPDEQGEQWYPNLVQHALTRLNVVFKPS